MITREHTDLAMTAGAVFSDCERYRYRLWRQWDAARPAICFVMLNPSTADERANDPTIERCQRRAFEYGFGRLEIANLFPYRATDPDDLLTADATGPEPDAIGSVLDAGKDARLIVCGWGSHKVAPPRAAIVLASLRLAMLGDRLHALRVNDDGQPGHPLYLPYDLKPVRYQP